MFLLAACRCEILPEHSKADLRVVNSSGIPVLDAQLKMGNKQYINSSLSSGNKQYDSMAKVVPQGLEDASKGRTSQLCCGGACSTPLSRDGAQQLADNPSAHLNAMRPSLLWDAFSGGMYGAASGAGLGAVLATAGRVWGKGSWRKLDREDAAAVGEVAGVAAAAGGAAGAVAAVAGGLAGGVTASTTSALYSMYRTCGSNESSAEQCSVAAGARKVFQGAVGAAAVVTAGGFVGPVLAAATGPGTLVLTPLVSAAVGVAAQHGGGAVADTLACPQTYHAVLASQRLAVVRCC
jgi:hypothetical protein